MVSWQVYIPVHGKDQDGVVLVGILKYVETNQDNAHARPHGLTLSI